MLAKPTHNAAEVTEKIVINLFSCIGFVWQGFGSWGATGVASVGSCQKLPLCPTEPVPAGSKTDLLLAKTKPVSNGGSASVITNLRRKEKTCVLAFCSRRREE